MSASVTDGLEFLTMLFDDEDKKRGYSAINVARSALSSVLVLPGDVPFGQQRDVMMFMKGVKALRPTTPKYISTWDPADILQLLKSWPPNENLPLLRLAEKTAVLMCLTTGLRGHTLLSLDIGNMKKSTSCISFLTSPKDFKQGGRTTVPGAVEFKRYEPDQNICVYTALSAYIMHTEPIRNEVKQLFLTSTKPHKGISRGTLSRWILNVMKEAGIDTASFSAGSTRSAATSAAKRKGADLETVLKSAGWSRASTFARFYDRPLEKASTSLNFADAVLQ